MRRTVIVAAVVGALVAVPVAVYASHAFTDVSDSNTFHEDIAWLADAGVTKGCNPPANTSFCPSDNVTREQMAAFMRRFAVYLDAEDGTPGQADNADTVDGLHANSFVQDGEANSISTVMLQDAAVNATKTADEPGVAQQVTSGLAGTATTPSAFASVQINAPTDGYVLAIGKASYGVPHVNGIDSAVQVGISTSPDSLGADQNFWFLEAALPSGSYGNTLSIQKLFPVSAGSHTFHLVAMASPSSSVVSPGLSLVFLSSAYGTVDTD